MHCGLHCWLPGERPHRRRDERYRPLIERKRQMWSPDGILLVMVQRLEAAQDFVLLQWHWAVEQLRRCGALPPAGPQLRAVAQHAGGAALPCVSLSLAASPRSLDLESITCSKVECGREPHHLQVSRSMRVSPDLKLCCGTTDVRPLTALPRADSPGINAVHSMSPPCSSTLGALSIMFLPE
jgi:hypothetical protein